ncbi:MAG: AI-2E family transporter [Tannerellaceae bacterium]|nr:AI-2E family transporter [Tannerellaceae bacterium]MCD8262989.1 AI-2E family transporter [Tannerellaceae bacterium]
MNPLFDKPFTFDRVARISFSILIISGVIYFIAILRNALLPFLVAWLLAYLVQPFVRFFQYKLGLKNRILAIAAALLTIALVITAASILVVPSIVQEMERLIVMVRTHSPGDGYIPFIPESWRLFIKNNFDLAQIIEQLSKENLLNGIKEIAPKLWTILSNTFSILFSSAIIFVILLYFIFILLDYEKITRDWYRLIPTRYRPFIQGLGEDVQYNMNRYFRGQSLIALCVGVLVATGFKIVNFPLGISLGLLIGLLNLIPYLQLIGFIPMIILSLLRSAETGQNFWLIFGSGVLVLGIVQVIQDLYLTPRIMEKAMGLNPAIILLSLSIWGTLLGFVGVIIALPLTTLCLSYYKRFILMEGLEEEQNKIQLISEEEKTDNNI